MTYLRRYIEDQLAHDIDRKMVFVSGPRQTGKTTLAKQYALDNGFDLNDCYMNWDDAEDRERIIRERFPVNAGFLILDEIHKFPQWRQAVKGLFDKHGRILKILVTGSARLDWYRRGGDSLQGRYHFLRLLPLTLAELHPPDQANLQRLLRNSGFPEPFTGDSEIESRRWSREFRSRLVRDDLRDLENIRNLVSIETLALRLPELVGSPLSINAVREDLQVSHQSVTRWLDMLESLYYIFRIYPFGSDRIRALNKPAKHYMYDWTVIPEEGEKFENLVACHLLKWCLFMQDTQGKDVELRYFRDIDGREVDFVVMESGHPVQFIECKIRETDPSRSLRYLKTRFPDVPAAQLSLAGDSDLVTKDDIRLVSAHRFLAEKV